ncbi:hypothetical protein GALMADRAFT_148574 [Galerina marginata CBS 339.88]|uniref:Uncharacterized protein n=1 Tax=Galerina marginata (strain CBS 339.88) TaxID=685588 RepID=A0A067SFP3_GALM3|nr:hypothetical protein GALMADRAFT_148574 [Galerina marginata CBS 339.88]
MPPVRSTRCTIITAKGLVREGENGVEKDLPEVLGIHYPPTGPRVLQSFKVIKSENLPIPFIYVLPVFDLNDFPRRWIPYDITVNLGRYSFDIKGYIDRTKSPNTLVADIVPDIPFRGELVIFERGRKGSFKANMGPARSQIHRFAIEAYIKHITKARDPCLYPARVISDSICRCGKHLVGCGDLDVAHAAFTVTQT